MVELIRADDPLSACAQAVARALIDVDRERGHARLAIPGGSAIAVIGALRHAVGKELWSRLALTWTDERCVPFASEDSSRGTAYRRGHLVRSEPTAIELPLYLDQDADPEAAVERVTKALKADFGGGIDVALLGLGPDGHLASLFPGHPAISSRKSVIHVADAPKPPPSRITLTLPVLSKARVFVFARGADKREMLEAVGRGEGVSPIHKLADAHLFTDGTAP